MNPFELKEMREIDLCTANMDCITLADLELIRGNTDVCNILASSTVGVTEGIWLTASIESRNSKDMSV